MAEDAEAVQSEGVSTNRLFTVNLHKPDRQKLKGVVLKDGAKRWYLNGMEIPHVIVESAAFKMLWGRIAHVTMTLEVELELVDEEDDPQGS